MYGNRFSRIDISFHLIFTVLWTCCASFRVNEFGEEDNEPPSSAQMLSVLAFAVSAQLITIAYIYKVGRCLPSFTAGRPSVLQSLVYT